MGRLSIVLVASFCVLLFTFTSSVNAQEESNAIQEQSPGFLERIMSDYVYPLRDYDWRGMVRRVLNGVMNYIAPDTKEPKAGFPFPGAQDRTAVLSQNHRQEIGIQDDNGVARALGSLIANWISKKANIIPVKNFNQGTVSTSQHNSEETSRPLSSKTAFVQTADSEEYSLENGPQPKPEGPTALTLASPSARLIALNSNITPNVAIHSWTYLGFLVAYSFISILGALVPIFNFPSEPLDEGPILTMPHNHIQSTNFQIK